MSFHKTLSHNLFFPLLQTNNYLGRSFMLTASPAGTQVLRDFCESGHKARASRAQASKLCKTQEEVFMRKDTPSAETMSFCLWDPATCSRSQLYADTSTEKAGAKSRSALTITQRRLIPSRGTYRCTCPPSASQKSRTQQHWPLATDGNSRNLKEGERG